MISAYFVVVGVFLLATSFFFGSDARALMEVDSDPFLEDEELKNTLWVFGACCIGSLLWPLAIFFTLGWKAREKSIEKTRKALEDIAAKQDLEEEQ